MGCQWNQCCNLLKAIAVILSELNWKIWTCDMVSFPRVSKQIGRPFVHNRWQRNHKTKWVLHNRAESLFFQCCASSYSNFLNESTFLPSLVWCTSVIKLIKLQRQVEELQRQSPDQKLENSQATRKCLRQSFTNPHANHELLLTLLLLSPEMCFNIICLRARKWSWRKEGRASEIYKWAEKSDKHQIE